jgi:serine/threonine protein kinase
MKNTRLTSAEQIFVAAIELEPEARSALLDARCGHDDALRQEVERMLAAADASEDYFAELPSRIGVSRLREDREQIYEASPGQQFGQYRLTEKIGTGGMGAVWRAKRFDGRFEGDVAVKLLTRLHNKAALEHFDREAHYLAKLSHPNITRLLDAGIGPDDVPYLILEYVEGEPIDRWCNDQALGIEERLKLVIQVADAVAHAHMRLIVHSDIKPANVLVTREGTVKLLDFGIASLLDDPAGNDVGTALTPEFAAPEQLAGESVSTATDVYALGMVLHLLLTGNSPRAVDEDTDLVTLSREARKDPSPLRESTGTSGSADDAELRRRAAERGISAQRFLKTLRGDIDPIVRKTLAVNPDQRYRNASELTADLRRYLRQEPIAALPHSFGYRSRKFVARHRGSVLSAALTTIALVAALGLALQQMLVARSERDAAYYERIRTQASNEFYGMLLEEMGSGDQPLTALELLDRGAALLRAQYDEGRPYMGRIYLDLSRRYASVAERDREREFLGLAESVARDAEDDDLLATVLCATASSLLQEDAQGAQTIFDEAIPVFEGIDGASSYARFQCTRLQSRHAVANGDRDRAIDILESERRRFVNSDDMSAYHKALLLTDLAQMHYGAASFGETLRLLDEGLEVLRAGGRANTVTYQTLQGNKATVLSGTGEYAAAIRAYEEIFARFDDAAWANKRGQVAKRLNYANSLIRLSRGEEALQILEHARDDARAAGDVRFEGIAAMFMASCMIELERLDDATTKLTQAEAILAASPGVWRHQLTWADIMRATIAREQDRIDEARAIIQPMLDAHRSAQKPLADPTLAVLLAGASSIELEAGAYEDANALATEALTIREATARRPESSAHVGAILVTRAKARYALGRIDEAIDDLERAVVALANGLGQENVETAETRDLLASYRGAH